MKYYIIENGNPVGPFEVVELIGKGLKGADLVWTEGYTDWVAAANVEEIAIALNDASRQSMPEMPRQPQYQQPQGYAQPPYQQPGAYQSGGPYQQAPGNGYYQQPYGQTQYQPQGAAYPQPQQPGWQGQQGAPYEVPPKSWLAESIILTLCCCLPIGIYCIVKASSVNSLWAAGQYDEARAASDKAKKWLIIGLIAGIVLNIVVTILNFALSNSVSSLYDI